MVLMMHPRKAAVAFVLAAAAWSAPAAAGKDLDIRTCFQATGDQDLAACNHLIDAGKFAGRQLAALYVSRGFIWQRRGEVERAFADFDRAVAADPSFGPAWNTRGLSHAR